MSRMTQPSLKPPQYLQPRPKAVPTFSSTSIATTPRSTTPQFSRPSSCTRQPSPARSSTPSDVSDRATAALVRRVLCPHAHAGSTEPRPINELLPPLTSSNDIDLQLYAIIAIVVKDLVQSWYGKITPDQGFVEEIVRIVAHCTTQLESRLRGVDLESLVFDELPELMENHINVYRISHQAGHPPSLFTDSRVIYHNLNPHPALSPVPNPANPSTAKEQQDHEAQYRQLLVQGALAILLPTEDLENACLRTLVADVIADSILGNSIGGRICEGWFIWSIITTFVDVVKARMAPETTGEELEVGTRRRLEKFGLLSRKSKSTDGKSSNHSRKSMFSSLFWRILQYFYLAFVTARFVIFGLVTACSEPPRSLTTSRTPGSPIAAKVEPPFKPRPIVSFKVFPLISDLLDVPSRMPWVSGALALLQHQLIHGPLRVGATDGILDQYFHHLIQTHFHPPSLLPQILQSARRILFPHSTLPPPSPSSPPPILEEEIAAVKRHAADSLLSLIPPAVCKQFFATKEPGVWRAEVERELDVWRDAYMNRHLAYAVLELVLVRVLPELAEKSVQDLLRDRIGDI
ncbi:hypothetical protein N7G274_004179 [Stereocaulon virgatum]|uniref:PXA domain-containing protein n=1 Tax=Stereocaulon virgatum TaxID=373712 RepID=A0ABR4ACB0_9LECA